MTVGDYAEMVNSSKSWAVGLLAVGGAGLLAPILLPGAARLGRQVAKGVIRLYFEVEELVSEAVAEYRQEQPSGLMSGIIAHGAGEVATTALEAGADESVAEILVESVGAALEVL